MNGCVGIQVTSAVVIIFWHLKKIAGIFKVGTWLTKLMV